jgi:DNA polymerase-3 subunit delta'
MQPLSGNHKQQNYYYHCLHNALLPHSLLFTGLEGIGKKLFALTFAKMMFCKNNACNTCPSCLQIEHGIHPDFIVVEPNDKGTIPIGNNDEHEGSIRWLIARISLAPVNGNRVVIINDAHTMNVQAQNALLKTIEEPPRNNFIILISSEAQSAIANHTPRITEYVFNPLSQEELTAILVHNGVPHEKHNAIFPLQAVQHPML